MQGTTHLSFGMTTLKTTIYSSKCGAIMKETMGGGQPINNCDLDQPLTPTL